MSILNLYETSNFTFTYGSFFCGDICFISYSSPFLPSYINAHQTNFPRYIHLFFLSFFLFNSEKSCFSIKLFHFLAFLQLFSNEKREEKKEVKSSFHLSLIYIFSFLMLFELYFLCVFAI